MGTSDGASTVFSHIVQKRFSSQNEDVATDALAFILRRSPGAHLGFMKLLRGLVPDLPDLQFNTQQSKDGKRPDMSGCEGSNVRVLIENKFWAGLTDNQPAEYISLLKDTPASTVLAFVVPAARLQSVWRELMNRLQAPPLRSGERRQSPPGFVETHDVDGGTVLALTSWSKVLTAIESEADADPNAKADVAQLRSLCEVADRQAFVPFTSCQISDHQIPTLVIQAASVINDATQSAVGDGDVTINGLRPQSNWERIGRYIRFPSDAGAWFGLHFGYWKRFGAPIWLVFGNERFGRGEEVRAALEPWALQQEASFSAEPNEFAISIELPTGEERDQTAAAMAKGLARINRALATLPPRTPTAGESAVTPEPSDDGPVDFA